MTELAAAGIPVTVTCRVLKLSRQPYYRWLADPITSSEVVEAYRANALFDAHRDDPEFGHRLLADEARDAGESMSDRTAWRIASTNGWWSAFGKKRGKGRRPGPPVHDDLCAVIDEDGRTRHVFAADAPNELWLVDITEHKTSEGKLYLCAIKAAEELIPLLRLVLRVLSTPCSYSHHTHSSIGVLRRWLELKPAKASCTCARSRTCTPTESSGTPSTPA